MDIESFVSEALQQIGRGVWKSHGKKGVTVTPRPYLADNNSNTAGGHMIDSSTDRLIVLVEFDLSVAVRSTASGSAGAGLEVLGIGGKGKVDAGIDHTRTQHIKFHVPISFTPQKSDT